MPSHPYRDKVLEASNGFISTLSDYLLIQLYFGLEMMVGGHGRNVYRASEAAWEDFFAGKAQGKRTLYSLKAGGLVSYSDTESDIRITKAGLRRLRSVLPFYDEKRIWEGKLYLVTYDIPEEKKHHREVLRRYLKKIGCGMLQLSVWITPYDPRGTLRGFVTRSGLEGMVIVSDVGKDGSVGGEDIKSLVSKVFNLNELNERYLAFISNYKKGNYSPKSRSVFEYISILDDDPQLPFALLPEGWAGDEAHNIYTKEVLSR